MPLNKFKNTDEYIAGFPENTQKLLQQLRLIIQKAAPAATEVISYNMPAFKQNTVLVYFAGYKNHIGFYPTGSGIKAFEKEFKNYVYSKGAVQFPLNKSIPVKLVSSIVRYRVKEDKAKAAVKKKSTLS
jgi:uncharacterized protein YdhG (YjbR/CyaY superfamily)